MKIAQELRQLALANKAHEAWTLYLRMSDDGRGHGLLAWRTFRLCYEAGTPVPPAVLKRFYDWAVSLEAVNTANELANTLEWAGSDQKKRSRAQLSAKERQLKIVSSVNTFLRLGVPTKTEAIARAAKHLNEDKRTVKNLYFAFFRTAALRKPAAHTELSSAMRAMIPKKTE